MTNEQFELYKKFRTAEFEYNWYFKYPKEDKELLTILSNYKFFKNQVEEQNIVLDEKYIPQVKDSSEMLFDENNKFIFALDKRIISVGQRICICVPEYAGQWSKHIENRFRQEGTIIEVIDEDYGDARGLLIKFEDGTEDYFNSEQVNLI